MLAARSYECPACGGLVREAVRICNYCRTPIATIRCGRCFTMNVPEAMHCMSCGAELGLEPVSNELCIDAPCPHCAIQRLDSFLGADGSILDCAQCGGQFVSVDVLHAMVRRHQSVGLDAPRRYRAANPAREPLKYIHCPICRDLMLRRNFGQISGVVVDVCAKHGTWFDIGELARILEFVGDGGLQRSASLAEQEQERVRLNRHDAFTQPSGTTLSELQFSDQSAVIRWDEMRDAALDFVRWVRSQLK
jgi:Zn-finger nucleic acid-binding protein